jgi:general secretion pathway protein J
MTKAARDGAAGITLVEMLVALALFSLVGLAGFTMLEAVLQVRDRTDGRLERLAAIDRALTVFSRDFAQADPLSVTLWEERLDIEAESGWRGYLLDGSTLVRETSNEGEDNAPLRQILLEGVAGLSFRVLSVDRQWFALWPSEGAASVAKAVELMLELDGSESVARLVDLPGIVPR